MAKLDRCPRLAPLRRALDALLNDPQLLTGASPKELRLMLANTYRFIEELAGLRNQIQGRIDGLTRKKAGES